MASRIKGITIEIDGETKGLDKALSNVNKRSQDVNKELRDVEKLLKFNPGNTELVAQKQKLLGDQVEATSDKLKQLKDSQAEVERQFKSGEIGEDQYRAFQREIVETESKLKNFEDKLETSKTKMQELGEKAKATGEKFKASGDKMKSAGTGLTKGVTAPVLAVAAGLGVMVVKTAEAADAAAKNARKVGVSTEAYQEFQYALGQTGLSSADTDKAIGRLNQRIGEARAGSDKYSSALKIAGVDMKSLEDGTLSTDDAMMQAVEGLSKIANEQDRAAAASELFGVKLGRELAPALEGGADGLENARNKVRELGTVMSDETGVKAEKFNDTLEDLQEGVKGAFQEFATNLIPILTDKLLPALQEHLIPAIQAFADKIQVVVEWFANLSPKMQATIGIILAIVTAIGPLLIFLGFLSTGIGTLMTLFSALVPLLVSVGAALATITAPVWIVIAAVAALVAGVVYAYKNFEWFRDGVQAIWEIIKISFGNALAYIKALFTGDFEGMREAASKQLELISGIASTVLQFLKDLFWSSLEWISNKLGLDFEKMKDAVLKYMQMISGIASDVFGLVKNTFKNALSFIKALLTGDFEGMGNAVSDQMENIKNTISSVWGKVMGFFEDIDLKQIGIDIMQGLINGIVDMAGNVADAIGGAVDSAVSWAKEKLGIASPSKVFTEIGEFTGEGLEKGIASMTNRVGKAGERMAEASIPTMPKYDIDYKNSNNRSNKNSNQSTVNNNDIVGWLKEIVVAVREGQIITMNERVLGQTIEPVITETQNRNKRVRDSFA